MNDDGADILSSAAFQKFLDPILCAKMNDNKN